MPTKPLPKIERVKRDDPEQSKLFNEKARELSADESSSAEADELLGRLARRPPDPKIKPKR